jgi:MFS family permease
VRLLLMQPANTFLPAFARDDLGLDAAGLGLLNSAMSVGLLVSSMAMASLGDTHHKGRLLLVTGIAGSLSAILMMSVRVMPVPFVLIALVLGFLNVGDVVSRTLMQSVCEISYRGRVLSIVMALYGLTSLSALPAGALADRFGVPWVVSALAAFVVVVYVAVAWLRPDLRKLR